MQIKIKSILFQYVQEYMVYKSAIIYNAISIRYSLEQITIKNQQLMIKSGFHFMKEDMQKLFFPKKNILCILQLRKFPY